jgi:AraC-like DNA-binding protein
MSISGNLKTMEAAELLQWLSQTGKTGTLVVSNGRTEKRIFFDHGAVTMTASSDPKEYLGHFLVSHGLIDEVALAKAMEMQQGNKMLLGKILVTNGAITEEALERMLRLKLEESVYAIFTWPEGEFQFLDDEFSDFKIIPLQLNINALVLEGVQRADDWKRFRQAIPSNKVIPVIVSDLKIPDDDPLAARILALVNDDRTVEELALHSHASEFHVCRAVLEEARAKRLKLIKPRRVETLIPMKPEKDVESASLLTSGQRLLDEDDFDQALRHFRAALSLEPTSDKIQQAVNAAEKTIRSQLGSEGIVPTAVPKLNRRLEDLASLGITPQEGFILTRVNGTYDIQTILKISPMPSLDALLVFRRLNQAEHILLG